MSLLLDLNIMTTRHDVNHGEQDKSMRELCKDTYLVRF